MSKKEKIIRISTDISVQVISNALSTACDLTISLLIPTGSIPLLAAACIAKRKFSRLETQSVKNIINNLKH